MKFICLGYYGKEMDAAPKAEIDAMMQQCQPFIDELHKTGRVVFDIGLNKESVSVRTLNGKLSVTDGPFAETKEQIGGIFVIEANDLNEAVQIAAKHPGARLGEQYGLRVAIHPVHTFKQR